MNDQNPNLHYNFPEQEPTRELNSQQYYLIISESGDVFRTKFKPEFLEVKKWGNIIFSEIVSNSKTLYYQIGDKEYSEKVKNLKISDAFSKSGCFHFTDLKVMGHKLKRAWIEATIPKRLRL
jgi:hypothetical protein